MVLIEAFAAGTPVVASDIAGYRQVVTHGRDGLLVPHGRPLELAEALRSLWLDPGAAAAMGVGRARARRGLRLAARRRAGRRGLRAGDRGAAAAERAPSARRCKLGAAPGRPVSAPPGPPAALARAGAVDAPLAPARGSLACAPPRGARALGRCSASLLALLALQRVGAENVRHDARALEPELGAGRARRSSRPRWSCARSPGTRSCEAALPDRPREAAHDPERHRDRGADVGDAAGPPRRAVACADRRAPARAHARDAARAGRDAGVADAPEPARAAAAGRAGARARATCSAATRARSCSSSLVPVALVAAVLVVPGR